MAVSQIEPTLKPYDTNLPPVNSRWTQDSSLNSPDEVQNWMQLHRPRVNDDRDCGNLEFLCTLNTPGDPQRECSTSSSSVKKRETFFLRCTLLEVKDLLRMPLSFWEGAGHKMERGGWWVRAFAEELTAKCTKCRCTLPAKQMAKEGCTDCTLHLHRERVLSKKMTSLKCQKTLGIVMQSALPEEIEKTFHQNLILDSTLTLPHI